MKTVVFCSILAICVISTRAIQWKDCGSKGSKIASVSVGGCETAKICPLPRGKNATVTVKFHANTGFSQAKAVVHGILADIPVPFPIPNPDGCKDSGLKCPVADNTDDTYSTQIYVKDSYPKVRVVVKWELKNEKNDDIFCMELPAQVSDAGLSSLRRSANHIRL